MIRLVLLVVLAASTLLAQPAALDGPVLRVIAMPRIGDDPSAADGQGLPVDDALLKTWRGLRDRALADGAQIIVFEITSPGGILLTAKEFMRDLAKLGDENVRVVAYVPQNASSAGAMLALACREIWMGPRAELGNIIPLQMGMMGMRRAPEKVNSETRQWIREYTQVPGFRPDFLDAMVDAKMTIWMVRKGARTQYLSGEEFDRLYPPGEARQAPDLTYEQVLRDNEALKINTDFARLARLPVGLCMGRDELPRLLGLGDRPLRDEEVLEIPRPEGFRFGGVRLPGFETLLLVAGVVFLVLAFKTPGMGLFEILALLSFAAYFLGSGADTDQLALSLGALIIGFLLIALEIFFFPGLGIPGIAGFALVLLGIYSGSIGLQGETWSDRLWPDHPEEWQLFGNWWLMFLGSLVGGTWLALVFARHLDKVPFLKAVFLKPPRLATAGPSAPIEASPSSYGAQVSLEPGMAGVAETDLRPSGRVRFADGSVSAVSDGAFIARGTEVRVLRVEGNRTYVTERLPEGGAS